MNESPVPHLSVLYQDVLQYLDPVPTGKYVDGTVGAGGHAYGILAAGSPSGELLGLDLDPLALELAGTKLAQFGTRVHLMHGSYADLKDHLQSLGWHSVDGILLDLGVSSMQLDQPEKGFSFRNDAPLDMRFDPSAPLTGADLLNGSNEQDLAQILWEYGEERNSRKIASAITRNRPVTSTAQLAALVEKVSGGKRTGIHPATRTFQAIRIAVNGELENLERVLPQAVAALKPGGRLAVISFHSLEDRIVKHFFQRESKDCICPPSQPVCTCGHKASLSILTRHPVEAGEQEQKENPRSRSARLRVAQKLEMA